MKNLLLTILAVLSLSTSIGQSAQDKLKMERERQAIQQELKEIQSVYNQVKGQKKETIGQVNLLQRKMMLQDRYIDNISKELRLLTNDIYSSNLEINRLQRQLDTLKMQYYKSVVYAYKNKSTYDYLNFIFSSSSFNDALKRVNYLKSYRSYRQQQVANIVETQKLIEERKQQLLGKKNQKNSALKNQTQQLDILEDQKKEKDAVVAKLRSKEKDLQNQISTRKKRDKQLKNAIAAVVRREIEAARKAAAEKASAEKAARAREEANAPVGAVAAAPKKASAAARPKSYLDLNESDVALNSSFEKNRGRLPWPVDQGYVSIPYGSSKVGGLSMDNPGITISTPSTGTNVKAIFEGEVSSVSNLGDGMMVMIRHGKYFSVYSNLSSVSVNKGMQVRRGQSLGRAGEADDGSGGQIDFLLMNETRNVNPEPWLGR
ncbi:MAG TPA: peptidoglycan DD-metalloendopeptidase family protein [Chitinophagaceae bacterium]|nr:peptidoglycan DD-metalloendopeptidase family protein [Chitinophagaceae bacterium]